MQIFREFRQGEIKSQVSFGDYADNLCMWTLINTCACMCVCECVQACKQIS